MMDSAWRQMDPAAYEPEPPAWPPLWSGSVWVVGPLMLGLVAAIFTWGSGPSGVAVILLVLALVAALVNYVKGASWYWQAKHLYDLKLMSFRVRQGRYAGFLRSPPNFRQLDAHFPDTAAFHLRVWQLVGPKEGDADLVTLTEADRVLWQTSGTSAHGRGAGKTVLLVPLVALAAPPTSGPPAPPASPVGDRHRALYSGSPAVADPCVRARRAWCGMEPYPCGPRFIAGVRVGSAPESSRTLKRAAAHLAHDDPFQFQAWALGLVNARVANSAKKGGDKGVDGRLYFHDEPGGKTKQIIFSVKAGHDLVPAYVRDLEAVVNREKAELGVLLSVDEPTAGMRAEAADFGFYKSPWGTSHTRMQLVTVEQLLQGKTLDYPAIAGANVTYRRAARAETRPEEPELGYEEPDPL